MKKTLIAGSRESKLALVQTQLVMDALRSRYPELTIELKTYKTQGDLILDTALSKLGDKGLFVKELENALCQGEIDFAVHSMKDMPSQQPEGLHLFPFGKRELPQDAFVSKAGVAFQDLPTGAVIGTSSLRREALLKSQRPDLTYTVLRGNVQTRLRKLDEGSYDAIVLAAAGLKRLDLEARITHVFPQEAMTPACCQGILGVEASDLAVLELFRPFIHLQTEVAWLAERAFLSTVEGGCQVPMAAYAYHLSENHYSITGMVCNLAGTEIITASRQFDATEAAAAGHSVAQEILDKGGKAILDSLLTTSQSSS